MKFKLMLISLLLAVNAFVALSQISNFNKFTEFEIVVPADYNQAQQLDKFRNHFSRFFPNVGAVKGISEKINDQDSPKSESQLLANKKYKVIIWSIADGKELSTQACKQFLREQKALNCGAQGLSLVWSLSREKFPTRIKEADVADVISFCNSDVNKPAMLVGEKYEVPCITRYAKNDWQFSPIYLKDTWNDTYYVVAFYEV